MALKNILTNFSFSLFLIPMGKTLLSLLFLICNTLASLDENQGFIFLSSKRSR